MSDDHNDCEKSSANKEKNNELSILTSQQIFVCSLLILCVLNSSTNEQLLAKNEVKSYAADLVPSLKTQTDLPDVVPSLKTQYDFPNVVPHLRALHTCGQNNVVTCFPVVRHPFNYSRDVPLQRQKELDKLSPAAFIYAVNIQLTLEERESLMAQEKFRLKTFKLNWPHESFLHAKDVSKAGFFYLCDEDRVQCAFCRGVLRQWEPGDQPMREHERHFPFCNFVRGESCGNVAYNDPGIVLTTELFEHIKRAPTVIDGASVTEQDFGISTQFPTRREYANGAARLRTFDRFPDSSPVSAHKLCEAGFYYTDSDDTVKCFYCDGALKEWRRGDDPWEEHSKWFPDCPFLESIKGLDFIDKIEEKHRNVNKKDKSMKRKCNEPFYHTIRNTEVFQTCVELGHSPNDIIKVTRLKGKPFTDIKELLEVLYKVEDGEISLQEEEMIGIMDAENPSLRIQKVCRAIKDSSDDSDFLERITICKLCSENVENDCRNQASHIGLPYGCSILCDDCATKIPEKCPKCANSLNES